MGFLSVPWTSLLFILLVFCPCCSDIPCIFTWLADSILITANPFLALLRKIFSFIYICRFSLLHFFSWYQEMTCTVQWCSEDFSNTSLYCYHATNNRSVTKFNVQFSVFTSLSLLCYAFFICLSEPTVMALLLPHWMCLLSPLLDSFLLLNLLILGYQSSVLRLFSFLFTLDPYMT